MHSIGQDRVCARADLTVPAPQLPSELKGSRLAQSGMIARRKRGSYRPFFASSARLSSHLVQSGPFLV